MTVNNRGRLFIIVGLSGAGKDTAAELLGGVVVKFAAPAKRIFEEWYGLNKGDLDDRVKRLEKVPGEDFTYLDVMVRAYHAWPTIDPNLTVRPVIREIERRIEDGEDVCVTDMRNTAEVNSIIKSFYSPTVLWIWGREGEKRLSSDLLLEDHIQMLEDAGVRVYLVRNNGTTGELREELDNILG